MLLFKLSPQVEQSAINWATNITQLFSDQAGGRHVRVGLCSDGPSEGRHWQREHAGSPHHSYVRGYSSWPEWCPQSTWMIQTGFWKTPHHLRLVNVLLLTRGPFIPWQPESSLQGTNYPLSHRGEGGRAGGRRRRSEDDIRVGVGWEKVRESLENSHTTALSLSARIKVKIHLSFFFFGG